MKWGPVTVCALTPLPARPASSTAAVPSVVCPVGTTNTRNVADPPGAATHWYAQPILQGPVGATTGSFSGPEAFVFGRRSTDAPPGVGTLVVGGTDTTVNGAAVLDPVAFGEPVRVALAVVVVGVPESGRVTAGCPLTVDPPDPPPPGFLGRYPIIIPTKSPTPSTTTSCQVVQLRRSMISTWSARATADGARVPGRVWERASTSGSQATDGEQDLYAACL